MHYSLHFYNSEREKAGLCRCDNRLIKSLPPYKISAKYTLVWLQGNIQPSFFCFVLFFFSLLHFLSVLIFKHKSQTNRPSVIARLIEYDSRPSTCYLSRPHKVSQPCFKRRALTAVLSWLDCSSTAARHWHDLVSDVEFNSVEQNGCCREQNKKN